MANQVFEERFIGKYDGVTPALLLPPGSLSGGANVRKVSPLGGWKVRKGCELHNTTAVDSTHAVNSLHQYTNPRSSDYHFLAQCNSLLYDATKDPPDLTGTTFGTSLGIAVGTTPGFSCLVKEDFFYADGSGRPVAWGGDTPYCVGFLVYNASLTAYSDYTRIVTDARTGTLATLGTAAADVYYVCSSEIASSIIVDLTKVNTSDAATCKVYSWVAGAWQERSAGFNDGTLVSGKTHARDGTLAWTAYSSDTMSVLGGIMGYWYKVEPTTGGTVGLSDKITLHKCTVVRAAALMTNKWNGVYEYVAGCRFFDQSVGEYDECLGKISNESTSQYIDISNGTTNDQLYIKTFEPVYGFGLGVVTDYTNTNNAQVDSVRTWNGIVWATCGTITDTTLDTTADSSFAQTGVINWNAAALSPKKRTWQGDQIPGYWYQISWDATLSASVRIYFILHIPFPKTLPTYDGCVEFKGRLFLWGDPEFPNRLRYSAYGKPDCFSGSDSGYTDEFGGMDKITCALPFYNELIVWKGGNGKSVWLLEGYSPQTFGALRIADTVGLASPKTAKVVEVGSPSMHQDEPMSIAIWQDVDGIYVLDGRKPRKASMPIDHYFNTEYTTAIAAASIANRQAFVDKLNNEYHFLLPAGELVYNYATDEWYPPWDREIDLDCGLFLRGTDGRNFTYGGSSGGWVCLLENDTSDKTVADADKIITHSVKTRAISLATEAPVPVEFTLRKLWANLKARTGYVTGTLTVETFKDMASTGTGQVTPEAMSMVNAGYGMATPGLDLSEYRCKCFQVEFSLATADEEMEIWSMPWEAEVRGELGVP